MNDIFTTTPPHLHAFPGRIWRALLVSVWMVGALTLCATPGAAETEVRVHVQTAAKPLSALAMILTKRGVITKAIPVEKLIPLSSGGMLIPVPIGDDTPGDAFVTALVVQEDKAIAMADVRSVETESAGPSYLELPECPPERAETGDVPGKLGLLDSLVKLRTDLREKYIAELRKQLTPDLVARLTRLEELFGIKQEPALHPDLPPAVLAERLSRLMESVNNYRAYSTPVADESTSP